MPILLDSHAWIWWVTDDRRLSKAARLAIVATARDREATLITRDERLRDYAHVRTLW